MDNRRQAYRAPIVLNATLHVKGLEHDALVLDLGEGGMLIQSAATVKRGSHVTLCMHQSSSASAQRSSVRTFSLEVVDIEAGAKGDPVAMLHCRVGSQQEREAAKSIAYAAQREQLAARSGSSATASPMAHDAERSAARRATTPSKFGRDSLSTLRHI